MFQFQLQRSWTPTTALQTSRKAGCVDGRTIITSDYHGGGVAPRQGRAIGPSPLLEIVVKRRPPLTPPEKNKIPRQIASSAPGTRVPRKRAPVLPIMLASQPDFTPPMNKEGNLQVKLS